MTTLVFDPWFIHRPPRCRSASTSRPKLTHLQAQILQLHCRDKNAVQMQWYPASTSLAAQTQWYATSSSHALQTQWYLTSSLDPVQTQWYPSGSSKAMQYASSSSNAVHTSTDVAVGCCRKIVRYHPSNASCCQSGGHDSIRLQNVNSF